MKSQYVCNSMLREAHSTKSNLEVLFLLLKSCFLLVTVLFFLLKSSFPDFNTVVQVEKRYDEVVAIRIELRLQCFKEIDRAVIICLDFLNPLPRRSM